MARTFKTVDYEAVLAVEIRLGDVLPAAHLARFVVAVVAELELRAIYGWYFAQQPDPPPPETSPKAKMAYQLQTDIGRTIYRLHKCTAEPVIGIIKEVLGFRQFSLRGLAKVAGAWTLVCIAFNLKRMHILHLG